MQPASSRNRQLGPNDDPLLHYGKSMKPGLFFSVLQTPSHCRSMAVFCAQDVFTP
ncbi:unnamed protein product [Protopolystoma xenopodis]|uniref:Uncharacterized protein n=1 Tax=Protopolystoma xenopodis TaxID=117903 RepID=A0A3S5A1V5_9PLAT|nr:unnamed protein product [Protopolystoma xenopodis]